jgi:light-regulated signal transduction histidine kinase (bacteriophytochrome)
LDEVAGDQWTAFIDAEDMPRVSLEWDNASQSSHAFESEFRLLDSDGRRRWFLGRAMPQLDDTGWAIRWFGTFTDIEELARANHDLEQFAYAASHSLQEPIRSISLYIQLVQQRYSEQRIDEVQGLLAEVLSNGDQLVVLLRNLRLFLDSGRRLQRPKHRVDSLPLIYEILIDLQSAISASGATVTWDPFPDLYIERRDFAVLLHNLISNALMFRRADSPAIHLGVHRESDPVVFYVQDNGEGIPSEFQETIFRPFGRLHPFPHSGSGLGLAICARLVEKYGGRIWVHSTVGIGSSFYFTLPNAFRPFVDPH